MAALGLIDPGLRMLGLWGAVVAVMAAVVRGRTVGHLPVLLAFASTGFALCAFVRPEFRADAAGYYVYLRSAVFDHDLDFANEWQRWRFPPLPVTVTGHRPNPYSVGPALWWSPFFAVGHVYVLLTRCLGVRTWPGEGYEQPYLNSLAVGSITAVVLGGYLLVRSMARYLAVRHATVVVVGAILTSTIAYYAFVVPAMAHALTFGVTCAVVWVWHETHERPSPRAWMLLGLGVGLAALARWQAAVLIILPATLATAQIWKRRARPTWILAAVAAGIVGFLPQMLAWKVLFGRWLTMPQGGRYVDWSSPHLLDVLFSAERGFFNWTPLTLVGTFGLLILGRQMPLFATASLAVLSATAWVNGGVSDWEGSDAFGARRFDLAVPFTAWGLAALARWMATALQRRPWAAVGAVFATCSLWNAGFIRLVRVRNGIDAAPFEWLVTAQAHQFHRVIDGAAARWGGGIRPFLYNVMVGEYFYYNASLGGTIDVGAIDSPWLAGGWSAPERTPGWPAFRWGHYPKACVRVPLQAPIALRSFVRARAPARIPDQSVQIVSNGVTVATLGLEAEWRDIPFTVPAEALHAGENAVCLEFARTLPGEDEGSNAAAVALIQLP